MQTLWWISFMFGLMVNIGLKFLSAPALSQGITLGSRSRTLKFHIKVKKNLHLSLYSYIMKTLLLVSLILSMMVYIGLKFFLAPSPSWGMAFKSRSQTFHTNVIFAYIIKADWFHWYMVIVIGLKFYLAQSLHLCLTFEVKGFILCVIQLPSPESKLHTLCSLKSGGSAGRGYACPMGTLSSYICGVKSCKFFWGGTCNRHRFLYARLKNGTYCILLLGVCRSVNFSFPDNSSYSLHPIKLKLDI